MHVLTSSSNLELDWLRTETSSVTATTAPTPCPSQQEFYGLQSEIARLHAEIAELRARCGDTAGSAERPGRAGGDERHPPLGTDAEAEQVRKAQEPELDRTPEGESMAQPAQKIFISIEEEIREFWGVVNPHKLDRIGNILAKYQGREQQLLDDLHEKYGKHPKPPRAESIQSQPARRGPKLTCVLEVCSG